MADTPTLLRAMFDAAVSAAQPDRCVPANLPDPPRGRTIVVGAGKASAAMAKAFEDAWTGELSGLVVTRYGHAVACDAIEIVEAAHPVPDQNGLDAARRMIDTVGGLSEDDLVVALISGGGSALLTAPAEGISFADKQAVNAALLKSGAPIGAMNCVRKHLSAIKGGRLAVAASPARVHTILISDVPGNDPAEIASGPTVPDPTTSQEALAFLERYGVDVPASVRTWLADPRSETPKPGDVAFEHGAMCMAAAPAMSIDAAAAVARDAGFTPVLLGDAIEGEAREVGAEHARLALEKRAAGEERFALISGGETTVTVRGNGRGGRNAEYLLGHAIALAGIPDIHAIACDTDGIDGSEDNAGAWCDAQTLAQVHAAGGDPQTFLANNDAYGCFELVDRLIVTGPTLTNVNDFRATLVE